jgi:hypothetical protein
MEVEQQFCPAILGHADISFHLDEEFCIEVGGVYDAAADAAADPQVMACYEALGAETEAQFTAMIAGGLTIHPWLLDGQPYRSSAHLREQVASTGTLFIYLTRCGHGALRGSPKREHPLCRQSGVVIDGEPLLYNDLFRAVHDGIGHVLYTNGFGLAGELMAAFAHSRMYSPQALPALLTETVGQICWFNCGPHTLSPQGRRLRPGEAGYREPGSRPYADQKVFAFPDRLISQFLHQFRGPCA